MERATLQEQGLDNVGVLLAKKESGSVSVREVLVGKRLREVFPAAHSFLGHRLAAS